MPAVAPNWRRRAAWILSKSWSAKSCHNSVHSANGLVLDGPWLRFENDLRWLGERLQKSSKSSKAWLSYGFLMVSDLLIWHIVKYGHHSGCQVEVAHPCSSRNGISSRRGVWGISLWFRWEIHSKWALKWDFPASLKAFDPSPTVFFFEVVGKYCRIWWWIVSSMFWWWSHFPGGFIKSPANFDPVTWCFRLLQISEISKDMACSCILQLLARPPVIRTDQASKSDQVLNLNSAWKWETESIWEYLSTKSCRTV